MLELILRKSLPMFVGCAAAIYFCLIRDRRWRVAHYAERARTTHHLICLTAAAAAACFLVYLLRDAISCPPGYEDPELQHTRGTGGKGGIKIVCHDDGHTKDGSLFAGLFALAGAGVLAFAGTSAVLRGLGPPAPAPPLPRGTGTPTDKRDRRRRRKREHRPERDG